MNRADRDRMTRMEGQLWELSIQKRSLEARLKDVESRLDAVMKYLNVKPVRIPPKEATYEVRKEDER